MNYQEFLEYIAANLSEYLKQLAKPMDEGESEYEETGYEPAEYEVELNKLTKNNGILLDGIMIRRNGERSGPNIHLNGYYDSYQMGCPLTTILGEIASRYHKVRKESQIEIADLMDFSEVKNQIVLRIVNYERNQKQLEECPHNRYLDLAITFRYIVSKDMMGIASVPVTNQEFEAWGIGMEELYQLALFNTMREFPWRMDSLAKVICDTFKQQIPNVLPKELLEELEQGEDRENGVNMFVLTNTSGLNGATCILYDKVIQNFARFQESNVYILPSSVHEVMLVPENAGTEPEFLEELVSEANKSAVGLIDLLSDHVYYYDREKDCISVYGQD